MNAVFFLSHFYDGPLKGQGHGEGPNPDHAPRGAFLHAGRGYARRRSDRLIGTGPLTMQRVWG